MLPFWFWFCFFFTRIFRFICFLCFCMCFCAHSFHEVFTQYICWLTSLSDRIPLPILLSPIRYPDVIVAIHFILLHSIPFRHHDKILSFQRDKCGAWILAPERECILHTHTNVFKCSYENNFTLRIFTVLVLKQAHKERKDREREWNEESKITCFCTSFHPSAILLFISN